MLQADSEAECQAWIAAIQKAVSSAYSRQDSAETAVSPTAVQSNVRELSNNFTAHPVPRFFEHNNNKNYCFVKKK